MKIHPVNDESNLLDKNHKMKHLPLPMIDSNSGHERVSNHCRMGFLSVIAVLLLACLVVKYFINDERTTTINHNHQNIHHHKHLVATPSNNTPNYLAQILAGISNGFATKHLHINESAYMYHHHIGLNISETNDCFKNTLSKLTNYYKETQLFLINFLSSNDEQREKIDANDVHLMGGYGSSIDFLCNDDKLLTIESGASMTNEKFPKYLDVEDLIDMKVSLKDLRFHSYGKITLYPNNTKYFEKVNDTIVIEGKLTNKIWTNVDDDFQKYLDVIFEEMSTCNTNSELDIVGYGGGYSMNECDMYDLLDNAFFFDYFTSN